MTQDENSSKEDALQDVPTTDFKSAREILNDSVSSIKELSPVYRNLGWAGFFGVSSVVIALLTIALSFLTGTGGEGRWYGGITFQEEILFMVISGLFALFGLIFLMQFNDKNAELQKLQIEIDHNRNKWLHEQTMVRLNSPHHDNPLEEQDAGDSNAESAEAVLIKG